MSSLIMIEAFSVHLFLVLGSLNGPGNKEDVQISWQIFTGVLVILKI